MYIIIGCGFLGSYLLKRITAETDEQVVATVRDVKSTLPIKNVTWVPCDVSERGDLIRLASRCGDAPKTVFYFAAAHNIDEVFLHPEASAKVNVDALNTVFETIPNIENLFFASTDCVYGENTNKLPVFFEASPTNPLNEYGRQKLRAERIVRARGFTVLRLPFLFGPSILPQKKHFYDALCKKLLAHQPIEMIDGFRRSMLSYSRAADLLFRLSQTADGSLPSIVNVCADQHYTKYEIGCLLADKLHVSKDLVCRITEEEGQKFFLDVRASSTVMDNTLLKKILGITCIEWENS